jgi:hypothetical protein
MGVDNDGILMLGKVVDDDFEQKLMKHLSMDEEQYDAWKEHLQEDGIFEEPLNDLDGMQFHGDSGYSTRTWFFGFVLGDSGSYDYSVYNLEEVEKKINIKASMFASRFGIVPELILFNYQW